MTSVVAGIIFLGLLAVSLGLSHYLLSKQLTDVAIMLDSDYQKRLATAKIQMTQVQQMLQEQQESHCSDKTISLLKNKLFKQSTLPVPWVRFNGENIICSALGRWPAPSGGRLLSRHMDGHGLFEGSDDRTFNQQKAVFAGVTDSVAKVFVPVQSIQAITNELAVCQACGDITVEVNGVEWINRRTQPHPFFTIEYQADDSDFKYILSANESARNQLWLTLFLLLLLPCLILIWSTYLFRLPIIKFYWHKKFAQALKKEAFYLAYQPIIDTNNHKTYCVEALLRWQVKGGGHRETSSYIRYLEQDSIMPKITQWMIKTTLNELKSLLLSEQIAKCSINISAQQIEHGNILPYLQHLADRAYPIEKLCFELTERHPISCWTKVREFIAGCKQLGCQIKLDDVGTGYGGGLMLQQLEFDYLKIDKAFTKMLTTELNQAFLIRSYIAIATEMNIGIIAEGVETQTQAEMLKQLGIHLHQGWLYAKALPARELRDYLLNH
ncbi:EAL domain-containing protein [Shewanella sp. 1CM18E]|uniref:EAL domain-containing protein n=1 Tax=Shewanella sp. 1CM18E TaxID=2929169 RepID=UPI0020BF765A|nr:EAL domain-containing protein [Shewanella sp. 1CM18E]